MAKATIYIKTENEAKWNESTHSAWINQALKDNRYFIAPVILEPIAASRPVYDPKLGHMVSPD